MAEADGTTTTQVRGGHSFDESALEAYLARAVSGFKGPLVVKQFSFGQSNPSTWQRTIWLA